MHLGGVSVEAYNEVRAQRDEWKTLALDLIEKNQQLKLAGGALLSPPVALVPKEIDPVVAAITAKSGTDARLRVLMSREAMRARRLGVPDHEIIEQIESGADDSLDGITA